MVRAVSFGAVGLLFLLSGPVALAGDPTKPSGKAAAVPREREWTIGAPLRYANLTLFPVISKTAKNEDRFLTLDEGLKAGSVEVMEMSAGVAASAANDTPQQQAASARAQARGNLSQLEQQARRSRGNDVNRVLVHNKSQKSLYLMPGEIIIGGDQDRTVGRELVISPGQSPVPIDVYCVEHGRWGARQEQTSQEILTEAAAQERRGSTAFGSVTPEVAAKQSNEGKFIGSVGSLNKSARVAVQAGAGQNEVWKEVGKENDKSRVKASSGAFTGQYTEKAAVQRLDPYIEKLQRPVAETRQVIGVVVAVNGRVESLDVFESTPLFLKLWPKLMKSYALDAANAADDKTAAAKSCSERDALAFIVEMEQSAQAKSERRGDLANIHYASDRVHAFSLRDAKAAPSAGFGQGGGGLGGIHTSGFAK